MMSTKPAAFVTKEAPAIAEKPPNFAEEHMLWPCDATGLGVAEAFLQISPIPRILLGHFSLPEAATPCSLDGQPRATYWTITS